MKCYKYDFNIPYGSGQGIVFAKNEQIALELIKLDKYYYEQCKTYDNGKINLRVIEVNENSVLDFSYVV